MRAPHGTRVLHSRAIDSIDGRRLRSPMNPILVRNAPLYVCSAHLMACIRFLVAIMLLTTLRIAVADTTCADLEALGLEVSAARDSHPAEGVERGREAVPVAEAMSPPCPTGHAMLLGGIASNLHILGRNPEAVLEYEKALEISADRGSPSQIASCIGFRPSRWWISNLPARALRTVFIALGAVIRRREDRLGKKQPGNIGHPLTYRASAECDLHAPQRPINGGSLDVFEESEWQARSWRATLVNWTPSRPWRGRSAPRALIRIHLGWWNTVARTRPENNLRLQALDPMRGPRLSLFGELGNKRGGAYSGEKTTSGSPWSGSGSPCKRCRTTSARSRCDARSATGSARSTRC